MRLGFTVTIADWSAILGSMITIVTVVGGFWKWARTQSAKAALDNASTGAAMRTELREENKILRQENHLQYENIRALQGERDQLKGELIDVYHYLDLLHKMLLTSAPAILHELPKAPRRLILPNTD